MRIIVTGGRKFADAAAVDRELSRLKPTLVIVGDGTGADALAFYWARANDVSVEVHRANWLKYHNAAGPIRNAAMIKKAKPDLVVAFPGGTGTADCVRKARAAGIEVLEVTS